jgi:hypothetical protein
VAAGSGRAALAPAGVTAAPIEADTRTAAGPAPIKAVPTPATPVVERRAAGTGQSALVAAIQGELERVGCFSGQADGIWSERTRVAMGAFNSSVRVNLPIEKPDYILLTLLQGHSARACSRSCEAGAASCIDKTIEARAIAPAAAPAFAPVPVPTPPARPLASATAKAVVAGTRESWTTSVATPVVVVPNADAAPRAAAAAPALPTRSVSLSSTTALVASEPAPAVSSPVPPATAPQPLPGRMAVGASMPPVAVAPAGRPVARAVEVRELSRPAPARARTAASAPRGQRMFRDLSLSAP